MNKQRNPRCWTQHELAELGLVERTITATLDDGTTVMSTRPFLILDAVCIDLERRLFPEGEDSLDFCDLSDLDIDFEALLKEETDKYHRVIDEIKESVVGKLVNALASDPKVLEYTEHGKRAAKYSRAKKRQRREMIRKPEYKKAREYFLRTNYRVGAELCDE